MSNEEEQEEDEDGDLSLTGLGGRRRQRGDSGYCNLVRQDRHQQHHSSYRPREVGCFERSGQNVGITKSLEAEADKAEADEAEAADEVFVTLMRGDRCEVGGCCPLCTFERREATNAEAEAEKKKRLKKCRSLPTSIYQRQYVNESSKDMTVQLNASGDIKTSAG